MSVRRPSLSRAPETRVPIGYFALGVLSLLLAAIGVVGFARDLTGHYYHPRLTALTHTVTLGWITLTTMGASYHFVPGSPGLSIRSWRLARWQLVVLVAGLVGLIAHFYIAEFSGMLWAAGLVGIGGLAHVANLGASVRRLGRAPLTTRLFAAGLAGFVLTLGFGILLATDRAFRVLPVVGFFPILHAHLHLALLGWVMPSALAIATRACRTSLRADEPTGWTAAAQLWGLAIGVPLVTVGLLASPALLRGGAIAVAAAGVGHVAWLLGVAPPTGWVLRDWGARFVLGGAGFLLLATALGLGLAFDVVQGPRAALAYAALALGGWASFTLVGTLLTLRDAQVSSSQRAGRVLQGAAWWLSAGGVVTLASALGAGSENWIRAAGVALVLGAGAVSIAASRPGPCRSRTRPGPPLATPSPG